MVRKVNGFFPKRTKEKISIGILAVGKGCGATHLTIAMANYLQSVLGKKTAVMELSGQRELEQMIHREGSTSCRLLGVSYYTSINHAKIPEILNKEHEAFVMDLGTDFSAIREEFLRCDYKIIVGSISPWRILEYASFLEHLELPGQFYNWGFLCLFGNRNDKKEFEKKYHIHMRKIPWIENPFRLKKEDILFLRKII